MINWLKGTTTEDNKLSLRFRNGSQIKASSTSADAGRSEALSLLVLDEAAHEVVEHTGTMLCGTAQFGFANSVAHGAWFR